MTAGRYLNGIDVGTGGVSAAIFDSDCPPFSSSSAKLQIHHPHPAWAEQDPDEWWSALATAVPQPISEADISAEEMHADVSNLRSRSRRSATGRYSGRRSRPASGRASIPISRPPWKSTVSFDPTIEPDPDRHAEYHFWLQRHRDLCGGVRDVQHEVVGHLGAGKGGASDG